MNPLNQQQKGLNYLVNFLQQLCFVEDDLSSSRILKHNQLLQFTLNAQVELNQRKKELVQLFNMKYALGHLINIYDIRKTPINMYLQNYDNKTLLVKRDLFRMIN